MGSFGFSLADRLGAKTLPCSVPGCTRTWIALPGGGLKLGGRGAPDPSDPASSMCDPCREKRSQLADVERPCDRLGCDGRWVWAAAAQLEAFAARRPPPRSLCAACESRLAALADKEIPCGVPGCARTFVFTRRAQLLAPDAEPQPPAGRCGPCEQVSKKLQDRPITCGIDGCERKWTWTLDEQLQAFAAGLPNEPPRRMCAECRAEFGGIGDREVKCRTSGCKRTWTWSRSDQLDACVAGKPAPKAPARMCAECLSTFGQLKDVERPCRRASCTRTWTDKRGAQLARAVRGKTGDPYPRYCAECEKELGELEDRQIPCATDNCEGTWTWTAAAQLAAGVRPPGAGPDKEEPGKRRKKHRPPHPPERHCESCAEFLSNRKTQEIPCIRCATPIFWPPESQLQTHIGNWAAPTLCGACKRDVIEAAREIERQALRQGGGGHAGNGAPASEEASEQPADDSALANEPPSA